MNLRRPRGFREVLPNEASRREEISGKVGAYFAAAGYGLIETPAVEYLDALDPGAGRHLKDAFRFVDVDGRLLALRTDVTIPLARVVANRFKEIEPPYRLRYCAEVFREQESLRGQDRQFTQLGIECIGLSDSAGDTEVLTLALGGLAAAGIDDVSLHLNDVSIVAALLRATGQGEAWEADVTESAHKGDFIRVRDLLADAAIPADTAADIIELIGLRGHAEVFARARAITAPVAPAAAALARLEATYTALDKAGLAQALIIDFSVMAAFDYYTGLVFELYAPQAGLILGSGGRYDQLLSAFGRDLPAAGFVYALQALEEVLEGECVPTRDNSGEPCEGRRTHPDLERTATNRLGESGMSRSDVAVSPAHKLRIAIPKGTLYQDSVALLESVGIAIPELTDPGRQLILSNDEVEVVIAKPTDVAIYVSYGAVDCGIGGRDILVEADFPLLELVDLQFGACEFVVAAPASTGDTLRELAQHRGAVRVATKYPRLSASYFDERGIQVEMVKLNGNIELAPLIGIADVIVDITATGRSLRDNDLVVLEHVLPSTARFVANPVSARTDPRVTQLAAQLQVKVG
jgi:ATP phosphoribosyltransferase regulatory subunit